MPPGSGSLTNDSTSSGSAADPIRSRYARRISFRRSAAAFGAIPFSSSFASMNRSTGVRTHASSFTAGGATYVQRLKRPELPILRRHLRVPASRPPFSISGLSYAAPRVDPRRDLRDRLRRQLARPSPAFPDHPHAGLTSSAATLSNCPERRSTPSAPGCSNPSRVVRSNSPFVFSPP